VTVHVISQQQVLFGGYRLTGQTNALGEAMTTAVLDGTTLGSDTILNEPGLKGYGQSFEGFWAPTEDAGIYGYQRTRNVPSTICLTDGAGGSPCRMVLGMVGGYEVGEASVGELLPFSYSLGAMSGPQRGAILHNGSATGNVTGTAYNLGAPSATVYGVLHVFSGTGSFTVNIQSATAEGFGTPNTRITFTTVATGTPRTYQWATASAGDAWWRITATNPNTRDFAVGVAIT
jgi:hypothetical protein